jgi:hypothetical protein
METFIHCTGNFRTRYCRGVERIIEDLGITIIPYQPGNKYTSDRFATLPTTLPLARRQVLAEWGYYSAGTAGILRCCFCDTPANFNYVFDPAAHPIKVHYPDIKCVYRSLALEDEEANDKSKECRICMNTFRYSFTFLPCGHSGFCYRCCFFMPENKCASCQQRVRAIVKTFHPS